MEYITTTFQDDGKFKIRVSRPVLTPEEHARRMKGIHDAAARLMADKFRAEAEMRKRGA